MSVYFEEQTRKIVGFAKKKNVTPHERYCLFYEVLRAVYEKGVTDGFNKCHKKVLEVIGKS
jgi:hypothetical protein